MKTIDSGLEIDIKRFIKDVITGKPFDGCRYFHLNKLYAIVFAWSRLEMTNDMCLCGKVAFNCDDLQCDYEWDWDMPSDKNGEVIDTELVECQTYTVDALYDWFVRECYTDLR